PMRELVLAEEPIDELPRAAPHTRRRGLAAENGLTAAGYCQLDRQVRWVDILSRNDHRAEGTRAHIHFRLRQVERIRALDITRGHVVADGVAEDSAIRRCYDRQLRLRHVPLRIGADSNRCVRP